MVSSRQSGAPAAHDITIDGPRFGLAWATLLYVLAVLTLAHPALLGQFLVGPHSDQYIAGYAFREFAASHLRDAGSFPQWNPYLFGGMPYVAAMHGDIFYPTFLLRMVLPTDVAMTWGFIIHLVLAGVFSFAFFRAAGISFAGALIGGLAYMLGGQLASLVSPGHDGKLFVSSLFPLALLLLLRWVRDGRRWAPPVLAVTVGLAVLSPHPQLLQYMLLASGAYALYVAIRGARAGTWTGRAAVVRLGVALGAVALGGLMGAIQYLPVREYVEWSPRAGGIADYAVATSYAWPIEEFLDVYLPQFSGILDAYWGRNIIHFHSQYVGAAVLVLLTAAFAGWRRDAKRGEILFWTITLAVALLWAFGGHTPFYRIPYAIVPGTKFFRAPATVFFVGALAISYLTAVGTERLLRAEIGRKFTLGWGAFALALALLATLGGLTAIAETFAQTQMIDRVAANTAAIAIGAWRSLLAVAAVLALAFAVRERRLRLDLAMWALAAVVTFDLWSVMRHYWQFSPPAEQLFAGDATTEYLRAQQQPGRVLALRIETDAIGRDANIDGDGLMVHDIRTTLGYHGNELARYQILGGKDRGWDQLPNPRFWELTNTRYLLSNIDSLPIPGATRVAGPTTTGRGSRVSLFDLPGDQPYAWVTPLIVKAPDESVLGTVLDPRFNPATAALFDTSAAVRAVENVQSLPAPLDIAVSVTSFTPGAVALELGAPPPEGSALVVSENYYPGWRATVDGVPAVLGRAQFSFIGVELPAGARRVELAFSSAPYETGRTVTLSALVAALIWLVAAAILGRRRSEVV
ncbi:MAG TPA: hypothetical protein VMM17_00565 [Gemmatimonadaceae bacterium]|nr:hypothetical protein [Gemmatimonadaceae bacterium]